MEIQLKQVGDYHVHLRDGEMLKLVAPTVKESGIAVAYVMPNLVPPLTAVDQVLAYKERISAVDPDTEYLMTLYLSPEITPEVIAEAAKAGIAGVKCYPAGVTTNSDHGVSSYEPFYPTFAAMEEHDMVLNLHGEVPFSHDDVTVMNAEEKFLPLLLQLHERFPKLRIVLEHCTTAAAIQTVKKCGPTVAGSITAHHLYLTVNSWGGNSLHFCKPVAKTPADRAALIEAATSGNPQFFFGSDSAPHPVVNKTKLTGAAAGVFTQPFVLQYLAEIFEDQGKLNNLSAFVSENGASFYKVGTHPSKDKMVTLKKSPVTIPEMLGSSPNGVVPFRAGETLRWSVLL
ncbi:hypothetical protein CANCADRAFT_139389 [Tortispora caseinolytica NRRL Y-17796]|uniref:dihydroorotase n=1 Tax=Tortispora caseinolytica NRRL Y-17796 TaxID=767744 RepID=A0A1E4TCE6_9ASCO|nr:hypothetical protein CANCADRAFT_139389 [Tortispora caseinolytica NRRL Y-17796]